MIILFIAICFLYQNNRRIEKKLDDSIKQTTEANKMEHLYDHLTDSETPESAKNISKPESFSMKKMIRYGWKCEIFMIRMWRCNFEMRPKRFLHRRTQMLFMRQWIAIKSVSYTHLDVYKRQPSIRIR